MFSPIIVLPNSYQSVCIKRLHYLFNIKMSLNKKVKGKLFIPIFKAPVWFGPGCSLTSIHTMSDWRLGSLWLHGSWKNSCPSDGLWCCLVAPWSQNVSPSGTDMTQKLPSPVPVPQDRSCCLHTQGEILWPICFLPSLALVSTWFSRPLLTVGCR